jgi:hypothetical protein
MKTIFELVRLFVTESLFCKIQTDIGMKEYIRSKNYLRTRTAISITKKVWNGLYRVATE